jgi:hypothetical protein
MNCLGVNGTGAFRSGVNRNGIGGSFGCGGGGGVGPTAVGAAGGNGLVRVIEYY